MMIIDDDDDDDDDDDEDDDDDDDDPSWFTRSVQPGLQTAPIPVPCLALILFGTSFWRNLVAKTQRAYHK